MTKKTMAEINTNNNFMVFHEAEKIGKREEWYKHFRQEYRKLLKKKTVKACKICDNKCDYCKFACNCSTEIEIE